MLDRDAHHEHENSDAGDLELTPHSVRLGYADVQREQHVDAADRLEHFGKEEHSDVYPRSHEDVLDVEGVPQRHLNDHADHRDEQESGDSETHRSPRLEDLFASARKRRAFTKDSPSPDPPIEERVADHEVR